MVIIISTFSIKNRFKSKKLSVIGISFIESMIYIEIGDRNQNDSFLIRILITERCYRESSVALEIIKI